VCGDDLDAERFDLIEGVDDDFFWQPSAIESKT
jgi:hypothetical protein